ncbi:pyridoxal 5'-phosphate synthase glutaminase subunit PdxT [Vallitalea okinawensis]|uniref:pyridoxal 5'-phosphate synthase glutaminase subunit PdxT n=1 Tax=Vallitalea okinawensis TaxID=2078660 RepID=UPI000CFD5595|nr:pyridoxal 5'-phosphate synthase glutaminase subunit PdxT [Vallitalea okinawensis]
MKIGILALQGSVTEHINSFNRMNGITIHPVRYENDVQSIDGLVIPGGESTTIGQLLNDFELIASIRNKILHGLPVWGTCAGMILLANQVNGKVNTYLNVMDIDVKRNGYGSQIHSFMTFDTIDAFASYPIPLTFIRAPYIQSVGPSVTVLKILEDKIIAAKQDNILVTSFHPELTDDLSVQRYFLEMIDNYKKCSRFNYVQ